MSSIIAIKLNLSGELNDKNVTFYPSTINPNMINTTIYFPTTFKITDKLIKKSIVETNDFLEIVTSATLFSKIIMKITQKGDYKPISLQEAESTGIVKENMMFYKNKIFKKNSKIFLSRRAYDILQSSLDENSITIPSSRNNLIFKMNINLKIISSANNNYENRKAISCENKRNKINEIYNELFGKDLFGYRPPIAKSLSQISPTMYSSVNTGQTRGFGPVFPSKYPYQMNPYMQNQFSAFRPQYSSMQRPQMQNQYRPPTTSYMQNQYQPQPQRQYQPQFRSMQPQMQRQYQPQFRSMQQPQMQQQRVQIPVQPNYNLSFAPPRRSQLRSSSVGGKNKTKKNNKNKKNKKKLKRSKTRSRKYNKTKRKRNTSR